MEVATDAGAAAPANDAVLSAELPAEIESSAENTENTEASLDDDLRAVFRKSQGPERDESGRFKSANPQQVEQSAPEIEGQTPESKPAETAKPSIDAPLSWPAELKAKWAAVPPEVQPFIAQREAEAHSKITQLGEQVKATEPFRQIAEKHQAYFAQKGASAPQWVENMVAMSQGFDQNPAAVLVHLGLQAGFDLRPFFSGSQQHPSQGPPQVAALQAQIAQLQQQIRDTSTRVESREQQEQAAKDAEISTQIANFAKSKPYFNEVRHIMATLLTPPTDAQGNALGPAAASSLEEAYEMATNAKPDIRQRIIDEQRKADEAKRIEEAKKRVADAKKAGSINVHSSPGKMPETLSLDDDLRAIWRAKQAS